jgi:hypothetical protein
MIVLRPTLGRKGSGFLKKTPDYRQLISTLKDPRVNSLLRKNKGYHVFQKLMHSRGWTGGQKKGVKPCPGGTPVHFYKKRSRQIVQVEASHYVWIPSRIQAVARANNPCRIRGAYLVVGLNRNISRKRVLYEVKKTSRALKGMRPLVVVCCRRP